MNQKETASEIQTISLALQGLLLGFLLIYPGLQGLNIFGLKLGFIFLPVVAIYYWPEQASYSWSLICIFLLGFVYDLISGGPIGLWPLSFLVLYLVLGTEVRARDSLMRGVFGYSLSVSLVLLVLLVFGRISSGYWPSFSGLMLNALASIAIFPLLYWIRRLVRGLRGLPYLSEVR